jgi:hypothetical protein
MCPLQKSDASTALRYRVFNTLALHGLHGRHSLTKDPHSRCAVGEGSTPLIVPCFGQCGHHHSGLRILETGAG